MSLSTRIIDADWKYAAIRPGASGWLEVGDGQRIYWEEYGNPKGEPVLFVHGGPGGGSDPMFARFFDPKRYRIVLFDQRGCGRSTPSAADDDPLPALTHNTTPHLIADIGKLREALGISGRMHIFGGSWGSTLALAYAIAHPATVQTLILRGIFLCRRKDLDYFYQGNAATYADDPNDTRLPGAYMSYPEAWKPYVEMIAPEQRHDMIAAYADLFAITPADDNQRTWQTRAAKAWSIWEGVTSFLGQDVRDIDRFADETFAKAFAKIENHYFMNGAFLGGSGPTNRDQNYLLEHVAAIKDIPVHIVHGRYDQVCPLFQAEELVAALRAAGATAIDYRITVAGHSMLEIETHRELTAIMDALPPMG